MKIIGVPDVFGESGEYDELLEKFGVSKVTLRDAFRSLEILGLIEIRKGKSGGVFINKLDTKRIGKGLNFFPLNGLISLKDLFEVRLTLEPFIAEKAALAINEEELNKLKRSIDEWDYVLKHDVPIEFRKIDFEFHRIIAEATGNPILILFVDFIENSLIDTKEFLRPSKEFLNKAYHGHQRIYKALLERDVKKVRNEIIKHAQEIEKDLLDLQEERSADVSLLKGSSVANEAGEKEKSKIFGVSIGNGGNPVA
jgi:GntR family transcriptional repressor for pyruvate dehydrogenase complex